jgi:hypothetical protein
MPELDTYDLGTLLECMNFIGVIQEFHRKNIGNMKKKIPQSKGALVMFGIVGLWNV